MTQGVLDRLTARYRELEARCYRTNVSVHRQEGRPQRDPLEQQASRALLKKMDLDRALAWLYNRFFREE